MKMSREARAQFDARGQRQERLSEYFDFQRWPDKAKLSVTRLELLALLTQMEKGRSQNRVLARVWRFLKRPLGSGPVPAIEPTPGEIARGEATP